MDFLASFIFRLDRVIWGIPLLILLPLAGIFLTFRLRLLPWRNLGFALRSICHSQTIGSGDISPFQSLMTSLSATVGVGNIAGVATAMTAGGPGALFWMWLTALFGLSLKYSESLLAVKFREINNKGEMCGGAMYILRNAFPHSRLAAILAIIFSLAVVIASFGIGNMTQSNAIAGVLEQTYSLPRPLTGIVLSILCFVIISGGIKKIASFTSKLVPFMAIFYFIAAFLSIAVNWRNIPAGAEAIIVGAFSPECALGGAVGITLTETIRYGVARGIFSNEAGLGSAPIAAAAASTDHCARQGYINMTATFIDTLVICTMTGLVIASSGILPNHGLSGAALTVQAFTMILGGFGENLISLSLLLFAFSTILGWSYYGEKSLEYLTGSGGSRIIYRLCFGVALFIGAVSSLEIVWAVSDIFNALMCIPNITAVLLLNKVVLSETLDFQNFVLRRQS